MTDQQQPSPQPGRADVSPVARQRFLETFDAQEQAGVKTYGVTLQTHNGRDFGRDAWEELVDLGKYITGLEMERDDLFDEVVALRTENYALHARVAELEGLPVPGHPDHGRCGGCRV